MQPHSAGGREDSIVSAQTSHIGNQLAQMVMIRTVEHILDDDSLIGPFLDENRVRVVISDSGFGFLMDQLHAQCFA